MVPFPPWATAWFAASAIAVWWITSCRVESHPLRPAGDGDDAGARHLDQAERQHQSDELVDLVGFAGELEHEALGCGIDHPRPERIGETQRLDSALAGAAYFDHRELALDGFAADRDIDDAVHRH